MVDLLEYHNYDSMKSELKRLGLFENAKIEVIGRSKIYEHERSAGWKIKKNLPIYALHISPPHSVYAGAGIGDERPSILFVGGLHGREWIAIECLIDLATFLVENSENDYTIVPWLLSLVDVWIIPMANPAGRIIDSNGGNPNFYEKNDGWRYNGDYRQCNRGVDLNRNFSIGWMQADQCINEKDYRGRDPFSASESNCLRKFVLNHSISMAVDIHSNSQCLINIWGNEDIAGRLKKENAIRVWNHRSSILADKLGISSQELELAECNVGGTGQFVAWMGEDRKIQTFILEMPFKNYGNDQISKSFRYDKTDTSNGFHPSGVHVKDLIGSIFMPTAFSLIEQAYSPGCFIERIIDNNRIKVKRSMNNPRRDFSLISAKIGSISGAPGRLWCDDAVFIERNNQVVLQKKAKVRIAPGEYNAFYYVQNNSETSASCNVKASITESAEFAAAEMAITRQYINNHSSLKPLDLKSGKFPFSAKSGFKYRIILHAVPEEGSSGSSTDDFSKVIISNRTVEIDKKIFEFAVHET